MTKSTRRQFLGSAASALAFTAGSREAEAQITQATQATPTAGAPPQDVVLTNGRIHTMDARNTVASSVTIRNGRIAAVGGNPPAGLRTRGSPWTNGRARSHRGTRPHRQPREPAGVPHDPREHDAPFETSRKRLRRGGNPCRRGNGSRRWVAGIRTSGPSIDIRLSTSSMRRFPIGRSCSTSDSRAPRSPTAWARSCSMRSTRATPVHPDIKPVAVADNGVIGAAGFAGGGPAASALFHLRRMQTFEDKKRSTTRRDDLLRKPSGSRPISTKCSSPLPGRCTRIRSCPTSINTGCTTRGWRCIEKDGRSFACR